MLRLGGLPLALSLSLSPSLSLSLYLSLSSLSLSLSISFLPLPPSLFFFCPHLACPFARTLSSPPSRALSLSLSLPLPLFTFLFSFPYPLRPLLPWVDITATEARDHQRGQP